MLARRTATPKSSTLQFNLMEESLTSTEAGSGDRPDAGDGRVCLLVDLSLGHNSSWLFSCRVEPWRFGNSFITKCG